MRKPGALMTEAPQIEIKLSDYAPPAFLVDHCDLTFQLDPDRTRVLSRIAFRPNPDATESTFFLHGTHMTLISARIDGQPVTPSVTADGLTCDVPAAPFLWEAEVEIAPSSNTALEGLYMSNDMYTTQCEAEGFRRITYYPDRPDVLAPYRVRIESDLPVLLSNGNETGTGAGWAEWEDPWPKPSYLFALVAGELLPVADEFVTATGRRVMLNIWVRDGDQDKCAYAMDSLKRAMRWDEEVYGREYDLDIFNIVAVDDFNSGAMENKGLNIFNSALVLCSPGTATDPDYERIESVIAHEYFHNWTGNRITCRDWFQLSLKEGLTVFRDQQFTSDMRSAAVKRIADVRDLRAYQFKEDAGPLSHPVRPESYVEINNFYTATVYEKGAELIGMLKRIVGDADYARALDHYFDTYDGTAATIEDWLAAFEATSKINIDQFKEWYRRAGTPRVTVRDSFEDGTLRLTVTQFSGSADHAPLHVPLAVGLLDSTGSELRSTKVFHLIESEQTFELKGLPSKPIVSFLRGFSAPVHLDYPQSPQERAILLAHDTDPFVAWDAAQSLATDVLKADDTGNPDERVALIDALARAVTDDSRDPAFRALLLDLPSEAMVAQAIHDTGEVPDPTRIHDERNDLLRDFALAAEPDLDRMYIALTSTGPFSPAPDQAANRALRNAALGLLSRIDDGARALAQFADAQNMTDSLAALNALIRAGRAEDALAAFEDRWRDDRLVMNKWFASQVSYAPPTSAVETAKRLTRHRDFDPANPNRFRSVLGAFAMNQAGFHDISGAGYEFFSDWLIRLDRQNPQVAARSASAFQTWTIWDENRKSIMKQCLEDILSQPNLSRDSQEMVSRLLGS